MKYKGIWIAAIAGVGGTGLAALAAPAGPPPAVPRPAAVPVPMGQSAVTDARDLEFFEAKVRPLLAEKCFACHSAPKAQGGLNLRTRSDILKGGVLGPSIKPGDPDGSLLVQVVRFQHSVKMPPQGKMAPEQIQILEEWVRRGAPWGIESPKDKAAGSGPKAQSPKLKAQAHWSFQPAKRPAVPSVKSRWWVKNPIDAFVAASLEKQGLKPNRYADRRTLIRRATFDLTGLPPTPEEIEAFVNDKSPNAWEKVIDRLLASSRYGERWGRHWLDVVRYSDSNGLDWNEVFAYAHRYRDYVIESFNEDKPYNQFVREQLAGDLMPGKTDAETYERITATGMLVMGPKLLAQQDRLKLVMDVVDEQIDVVSKGFMGLTVSCARCHDHKFDPVSTKDYYALAGIFKSTMTMNGTLPRNGRVWYWNERPLAEPEVVQTWQEHNKTVRDMQNRIRKCKDSEEKKALNEELKKLQAQAPPAPPLVMAVQEGEAQNVKVHLRGNPKTLGEEVHRGIPAMPGAGPGTPVADKRSGRLELANWIASPSHPLTGRVIVNRVWQGHFGRGIVPTPDNFGLLGEKPTHPELLDWLASTFTSNPSQSGLGWSLKKLHRLIMLSAAYQMSSDARPEAYAKDPENRWLWRMSPRRLEAEAIRDAMLASSGQLDTSMGGSLLPKNTGLAGKEVKIDFASQRRSVYLPVIRGGVYDVLEAFDFADPQVVTGRRPVTTVSTQALVMLNSPFVIDQSERMANEVLSAPDLDDVQRVELAYRRTLGRTPSSTETRRTLEYLEDFSRRLEATQPDPAKRRLEAWRMFTQTLFASNEFRYVN